MLLFTLEVLHAIRKCSENFFFKMLKSLHDHYAVDLKTYRARLINFELTDTSNNHYCTVHGKEILLHTSYIEP